MYINAVGYIVTRSKLPKGVIAYDTKKSNHALKPCTLQILDEIDAV